MRTPARLFPVIVLAAGALGIAGQAGAFALPARIVFGLCLILLLAVLLRPSAL